MKGAATDATGPRPAKSRSQRARVWAGLYAGLVGVPARADGGSDATETDAGD